MVKLLASMRFAFWSILAVVVWFLAGVVGGSTLFRKTLPAMNDSMIYDWLLNEAACDPLLLIWFVVLFLLAFLLALSFAFCTGTTLLNMIKSGKRSFHSLILFALHVVCLLIVGFHALSLVVGFKEGHRLVTAGDVVSLPFGYSLIVDEVRFVSDRSINDFSEGKNKIRYTVENFSVSDNFVAVRILRDGSPSGSGKAFYLQPMKHAGIRVTLESFHPVTNALGEDSGTGAMITITKNPLLIPFFLVYALEVILLGIFIVTSPQPRLKKSL